MSSNTSYDFLPKDPVQLLFSPRKLLFIILIIIFNTFSVWVWGTEMKLISKLFIEVYCAEQCTRERCTALQIFKESTLTWWAPDQESNGTMTADRPPNWWLPRIKVTTLLTPFTVNPHCIFLARKGSYRMSFMSGNCFSQRSVFVRCTHVECG